MLISAHYFAIDFFFSFSIQETTYQRMRAVHKYCWISVPLTLCVGFSLSSFKLNKYYYFWDKEKLLSHVYRYFKSIVDLEQPEVPVINQILVTI